MGPLDLFSAVVVAALIVWGWRRRRRTLRERIEAGRAAVDDDAIRAIERTGRLHAPEDEPLDLDEIAREERRFWDSEGWDSAERY